MLIVKNKYLDKRTSIPYNIFQTALNQNISIFYSISLNFPKNNSKIKPYNFLYL